MENKRKIILPKTKFMIDKSEKERESEWKRIRHNGNGMQHKRTKSSMFHIPRLFRLFVIRQNEIIYFSSISAQIGYHAAALWLTLWIFVWAVTSIVIWYTSSFILIFITQPHNGDQSFETREKMKFSTWAKWEWFFTSEIIPECLESGDGFS